MGAGSDGAERPAPCWLLKGAAGWARQGDRLTRCDLGVWLTQDSPPGTACCVTCESAR